MAPYVPAIAQLYTVHVRVMDAVRPKFFCHMSYTIYWIDNQIRAIVNNILQGIAAVYVLCGARTRLLYRAIFSRLAELAPGLLENLRFVMGDYERAAMSAVRDVFPNAALHGCWCHFNQVIHAITLVSHYGR